MVNVNKYCSNIGVITPEFYNYGSLLVAGIIQNQKYNLTLYKGFPNKQINHDIIFISLQSTIHLIKYKKQIETLTGIIVIGGPVTNCPQIVFDNLNVDLLIIGEAEETIPELLEALNKEYKVSKLKNIKGIAYKDKQNVHITKPRKHANIKRPLPFIPNDIAQENIRGANTYIETHRGCSGNCGFCQVPCFFGQNVRSRTEKDILNEVLAFKNQGAKQIAISGGTGTLYGSDDFCKIDDDAFTSLLKNISQIVGPANLTIPDIRVDLITPKTLNAIKTYTNGWVFYGIESGSKKILKKMQKGITLDSVYNAVKLARKTGLKVAGSFIVAYPGETEDDFECTLDLIADLSLDDYFISIAEPIPGTKLAEDILNCSDEDNLLYQKSKKYPKENYSVAEERALDMMLESYIFRSHPVMMNNQLLYTLKEEVKDQSQHIQKVMKLLKQEPKTNLIKD